MKSHTVLDTFKMNVVKLVDELIEIFPDDNDLYSYRLILKQLPPSDLMAKFIEGVLPFENEIEKRDEDFFLQMNTFFQEEDKFKNMWTSGQLDSEDKDSIWSYFDVYVELCRRYRESVQSF